MSESGALQQRSTYLISLTLVKVEAVEQNGGQAKHLNHDGEVKVVSEGRAAEEAGAKVEAVGNAPAQTENGARGHVGQSQRAEDAAPLKGGKFNDEIKDGERKTISPFADMFPSRADVLCFESEKIQYNLSISSPTETAEIQKAKSKDLSLLRTKKMLSITETKQCTSQSFVTTPSMEGIESSHTPKRTCLPIQPVEQCPVSLLKSNSSTATRGRDSKESRERSPTSAQSLDRKDCRMATHSPGPCRASWAEVSRPEGWRGLQNEAQCGMPPEIAGSRRAVMRDIPRKERLKTSSTSLPAPVTQASKPARKGKSCTLDNSDLNNLSEDLGLTRDAQLDQQDQRGSAKDRKMLRFISGIFSKSSAGATGATAPPVYIQRDSSEEEGRSSETHTQ